jgi:hypothetical protein
MTVDHVFYTRRLEEELELAVQAKSAETRRVHTLRADEYARCLGGVSPRSTAGAVEQLKLRRRAEAFGDWLAAVM